MVVMLMFYCHGQNAMCQSIWKSCCESKIGAKANKARAYNSITDRSTVTCRALWWWTSSLRCIVVVNVNVNSHQLVP